MSILDRRLIVKLKEILSVRPCAEVDEAYATAAAAQRQWARTPLHKRAEILKKAAALMRMHAGPMADALVKEIAKPAKDAMTEVIRSADLLVGPALH